jgi:hypothetical protein
MNYQSSTVQDRLSRQILVAGQLVVLAQQVVVFNRPDRMEYPCLPPTAVSAGREWFRRFGENNDAGLTGCGKSQNFCHSEWGEESLYFGG